jgi:polyisoprenoid-binding protein YceI
MSRFKGSAMVVIAFGLAIGLFAAGPITPGNPYRITGAGVSVICPLTVGGSFEARTSGMAGDLVLADVSGVVNGAVQVDLATLQTGIGLRDRHMKDKYLEIGRGDTFTTVRLEEIRLERAEEGSVPFHGKLNLHGEQHMISGMADLQRQQQNGAVRVHAHFPISLTAFGIQSPRYLGVGVRDEVQVQVQFTAVPAAGF